MSIRSLVCVVALSAVAVLPGSASSGGAIYTTNRLGVQIVDNCYERNSEVHLTGGPELLANCAGSRLDDGVYYFQVTDPAGQVLLSADSITQRTLLVSNGVVSQYLGTTHIVRLNGPCGAKLIQLMPFYNSPSPAGDYKLWMTPAERYDYKQSGFFGFDARYSKIAYFKVGARGCGPVLQSVLRGHKFFDHSEDGLWDPQADPLEVPIAGWRVEIYKDGVYQDATFTDANGEYQFLRDRDGAEYTLREVAPGGFIEDGIAGAVWLAKTPRQYTVTADAADVLVPPFGNLSFSVRTGVGRTKGFWHNNNGRALLAQCDPDWRNALTTWNGSPLCLRRNISSDDPQFSIFAPLPLPTPFATSFDDFSDWIVGEASSGHAGYILSTQVAATILNSRCGNMQFTVYVDRFQNGVLVPLEEMITGVQEMLLCAQGAGLTGPQDPYQTLRDMMLGCINEFSSINNTGDPFAAQVVFGPDVIPGAFSSPYIF